MIQSLPLYVQAKTKQQLVDGPLGPYLESIVQVLHLEEYKEETIRHYLGNTDLFGRWIGKQEIPVEACDEITVKQYISSFKRLKHPTRTNGCRVQPVFRSRKSLIVGRL